MDILKEKAQLKAQKLVSTTIDEDTQRQLEELKAQDVDEWFEKRKALEEQQKQAVEAKANELYSQYKKEATLAELKISEDELKAKLTAKDYEDFVAGKEVDLKKLLGKEGDPKNNPPKDPKDKSKNIIPDITRTRETTPPDEEKTLEETYNDGTF